MAGLMRLSWRIHRVRHSILPFSFISLILSP
jgi:hypothetical protein